MPQSLCYRRSTPCWLGDLAAGLPHLVTSEEEKGAVSAFGTSGQRDGDQRIGFSPSRVHVGLGLGTGSALTAGVATLPPSGRVLLAPIRGPRPAALAPLDGVGAPVSPLGPPPRPQAQDVVRLNPLGMLLLRPLLSRGSGSWISRVVANAHRSRKVTPSASTLRGNVGCFMELSCRDVFPVTKEHVAFTADQGKVSYLSTHDAHEQHTGLHPSALMFTSAVYLSSVMRSQL
jgi:hypothetical protein